MHKTPFLTAETAERLVASESDYLGSLLAGIQRAFPGLGGIERRTFGNATAHLFAHSRDPLLNRVMGLRSQDRSRLESIAEFYRAQGVSPAIDICPYFADEELLSALGQHSYACRRLYSVLYGVPDKSDLPSRETVIIRSSDQGYILQDFADVFLSVYPVDQDTWQSARDGLIAQYDQPNWRCYVAYVDGKAAAMGAMYSNHCVASLTAGATIPEHRGRGCQSALIQQRVNDAVDNGCDFVTSFTAVGSTSQRNMERLGLRQAYTKLEFQRAISGD